MQDTRFERSNTKEMKEWTSIPSSPKKPSKDKEMNKEKETAQQSPKSKNNAAPVPAVAKNFTTRSTFTVAQHGSSENDTSTTKQNNSSTEMLHKPKPPLNSGGGAKVRSPRSSVMDRAQEAVRVKEYRDRTKQMLTPSQSRDYSVVPSEADDHSMYSQHTDHEFQNLVADTEHTDRNAKCEMLGKHAAFGFHVLQAFVYIVGILSLLFYAYYVRTHSPTLSTMHSIMPTIFHGIGVGSMIALKTYYDFSNKVGHLESMHLIIRSRMWLFPGVLGNYERVIRSEVEQRRNEQLEKPKWESEDDDPEFSMTQFLKRCQFPEFRVLFRAFELYPYSHVTDMAEEDGEYADAITQKARNQIMKIFPVLDFLDCAGSFATLINPINWVRLSQRFGAYFTNSQPKVLSREDLDRIGREELEGMKVPSKSFMEGEGHEVHMTRSEELEIDDVGMKPTTFAKRKEPRPWGTVVLDDYEQRFKDAVWNANFLGFTYYFFSLSAYIILVFGEVHFYTRLDIARRYTHMHAVGTDSEEEWQSDDEDYSWSLEFEGLRGFGFFGCILMFLALPFGMQASALMAENAVAPMLVLHTLKAHVVNFQKELDDYLKLLAINKGSIAHDPFKGMQDEDDDNDEYNLADKISMTRDMALSWRMGKFFKEVEHDCGVINSAVALMMLNFVCHIIPLNIYLFDTASCIPTWVVLFAGGQVISLFIIIKSGIEANEMANEGIDGLLHEWQLKFNMIGWSGGFIEPGEKNDMRGFVARDPPGETKKDVMEKEKEGDADYGSIIKARQQNRIQSIVKVLAHYEAESINPFRILYITVTRDMLTLILGFFGGSIIAVISTMIDNKDHFRPQFMCHRFLTREEE